MLYIDETAILKYIQSYFKDIQGIEGTACIYDSNIIDPVTNKTKRQVAYRATKNFKQFSGVASIPSKNLYLLDYEHVNAICSYMIPEAFNIDLTYIRMDYDKNELICEIYPNNRQIKR